MFKLYLESINCLRVLNYLWGGQVIVYLLAWISGIVRIIAMDLNGFTNSEKLEHYYQCVDLITLNFVVFLLSILNFKKSKAVYLR